MGRSEASIEKRRARDRARNKAQYAITGYVPKTPQQLASTATYNQWYYNYRLYLKWCANNL